MLPDEGGGVRNERRADLPGVPLDRSNLCVRAFERLHPADGIRFAIRSEIPPRIISSPAKTKSGIASSR